MISEYCFNLCFFLWQKEWNLAALILNPRTGHFLTEWPREKSLCFDLIFFNYKTVMMACTHVPS